MKSYFWHIPVLLAIALFLLSACGGKGEKVIPRAKLSRIYAEMLLTDQWVRESVDIRRVADTSLVYEPILERYGYDKLDYIHTVDVYLDDPERFAKIWRKTSDILDDRLKELKARKKAIEEAKEKSKIITDFKAEMFFPYMHEEPYIHYFDSLSVEMDTLLNSYRFVNVETSDTTYDGLVMNVKVDTLEVADSLVHMDSVAVKEVTAPLEIMKPEEIKKVEKLPLRQFKKDNVLLK